MAVAVRQVAALDEAALDSDALLGLCQAPDRRAWAEAQGSPSPRTQALAARALRI